MSQLSIFEYTNYRVFLKDFYREAKSSRNGTTFRSLSAAAGFRSPNFFQLVMEGKRNLSPAAIEGFARALKLKREETEFFRSLVLLNQASSGEEKHYYAEQVIRSRHYRKISPLKAAQFAYYARWYHVPIRELVATEGFREDPEWIARSLRPRIQASQAKAAIETLLDLGLLIRNEEGRLVQADNVVATDDEVSSSSIAQFHREMIQKGSESIDRFGPTERDVSSVTVGLSQETMKQVKELVQKFRAELLTIAANERKPEQVYQVNFQLFPLSEADEEAKTAPSGPDATDSDDSGKEAA